VVTVVAVRRLVRCMVMMGARLVHRVMRVVVAGVGVMGVGPGGRRGTRGHGERGARERGDEDQGLEPEAQHLSLSN
jgi:hypothetical protein